MGEQTEASEKALDKMTVKELREIAGEIPEVTGVHGMKKDELLEAIKKAKGIEEETPRKEKKPKKAGGEEMSVKKKIQLFKTRRTDALEAGDKKAATILRRRINRLKKKSRRAA